MMENSLVNMHAVPHTPVGDMPLACHAVAIGASAGGIRALQIVLAALPPDFSAPILIVLHLEPRHESLLARVLGSHTTLRVKAAEPGETLVRGTVYLAVPDLHLLAVQDCVALASTTEVHYSRPSVDVLFNSIAASYGGAACGVILSGAGRDGAQGLAAIKAAGGMTIVQDPATADHRGMPLAAVATKCVDMILPVDAIAPALIRRAMAPNADGAVS
jgi:two-component system, chemotaxis family, protein-glutamate methylesterase/glutaminase